MQWARIKTPLREGLVAMEPTKFGKPYKELDDQTDESGWEEWALYSSNGFDNEFARADEVRYAQIGWWGVNFRDRMKEDGRGVDDKGRLGIIYISHNGLQYEKTHTGLWAPKDGFIVPTGEGIFHEGTLIPFETVPFESRKEALRRLEAKGIDNKYLSGFYRENRIDANVDNGERIVGRGFDPNVVFSGRFRVGASRLHSDSGCGGVASRPTYIAIATPEIVMSVGFPQEAKAE